MSTTDRDPDGDAGGTRAGQDDARPSSAAAGGAWRWGVGAAVLVVLALIGFVAWPLLGGPENDTDSASGDGTAAIETTVEADTAADDEADSAEVSCTAELDPADEFLAAICDPEYHEARRAALDAAAGDTGFSIGVRGDVPTDGYMVSFDDAPGLTLAGTLLADTDALEAEVDEFLLTNREFFAERTGSYLGGWINPDTEELVIGVSERYTDREESLRVGAQRNQIAVYDLGEGEDILVAEAVPAGG
ncbi:MULTISPECIES: hypothetical protein [Actinoalloteichus]|uniref:Uncharacterized protein n=1 Tax=Actinoalloteichus fjordicus TaxID=1612552 RepID=A0AAC9LDB3_9PSEU|nr:MULTISPECIES: hypothetical protein [Actinoalloteichus]APU14784.1 hypothetical protein UA74_13630 [Actinoalloteichus fjordicus]APU20755.1 hypothetical protein UA75_13725 [Actinoalloteichus sp. GBA129-24]